MRVAELCHCRIRSDNNETPSSDPSSYHHYAETRPSVILHLLSAAVSTDNTVISVKEIMFFLSLRVFSVCQRDNSNICGRILMIFFGRARCVTLSTADEYSAVIPVTMRILKC